LDETIPIRFRGRPASQSIYREVKDDFDEKTWRVNLDFTPNDDTLLYLSATTGYRAGGFNLGFFSVTPSYKSEKILAYELGYKGQLLDGRMQINAATYLYQYDDIHAQFTVENPFLGGTNTSVRNVPEAENYGFEGDVMWLATDAITLGAVFSYTKAEYQEDIKDPNTGEKGVVDINNPYAPPSLFTADQLRASLDGLQMNRIPEYKYNLWGQYSWQLGGRGRLDFLALYAWQDEMTWDESRSPLDTVPAFARVDTRITWNNEDESWMVAGFVNNLTDEIGIRNEDQGGEAEGFQRSVTPTLPRIWGLEVRYRFGAY
jgi:iron complex outermembrane receptor protein